MLELFESSQDYLPPIKEEEISDDKVLEEIKSLKKEPIQYWQELIQKILILLTLQMIMENQRYILEIIL